MQGNVLFLEQEWYTLSHFILKETSVHVNGRFFGFWFFFLNKVSRIRFEVFIIVMQQTSIFFSCLLKNLINKISNEKIFLCYKKEGCS